LGLPGKQSNDRTNSKVTVVIGKRYTNRNEAADLRDFCYIRIPLCRKSNKHAPVAQRQHNFAFFIGGGHAKAHFLSERNVVARKLQ
jgi:hypothetical protein